MRLLIDLFWFVPNKLFFIVNVVCLFYSNLVDIFHQDNGKKLA